MTKMLFSFIRFDIPFFSVYSVSLFGWIKKRYFNSNLWVDNPLGAFKDILQSSTKSVGRTHQIKFSDSINST